MPASAIEPFSLDMYGNYESRVQQKMHRSKNDGEPEEDCGSAVTGALLWFISLLLIVFTFPLSMMFCVKIVQEYERAVIFRLGRVRKHGTVGPGLFFVVPCVDQVSAFSITALIVESTYVHNEIMGIAWLENARLSIYLLVGHILVYSVYPQFHFVDQGLRFTNCVI